MSLSFTLFKPIQISTNHKLFLLGMMGIFHSDKMSIKTVFLGKLLNVGLVVIRPLKTFASAATRWWFRSGLEQVATAARL